MVGIIQEQHPDRARLFMQWKRMDWPILVDSLNLLGVSSVPITLEIDEYGVIRKVHPPLAEADRIEEEFLNRDFTEQGVSGAAPVTLADLNELRTATGAGTAAAWRTFADALVLWGGPDRLGEAIGAYRQALGKKPEDGPTRFRLGVGYRMRYDSEFRQPDDFRMAVESWQAALDVNPNQYIWRRRIQQYGPRLDKPYPFYDWVTSARQEIRNRGETPAALRVEPGGAEFAHPLREFPAEPASPKEPDPEGRIHRDQMGFIVIETVVVPDTRSAESTARVHVVMRPNTAIKAHWNNEAGDLVFWVNPPEGWKVDRTRFTVPNPPETVSLETRTVEIEIRGPARTPDTAVVLPAYALYYVCEDVKGRCLYRRQDITIPLN